jgi:hypothetical protein
MTHPTTDLVARLRAHIDRDQCVSYDWGEPKHDAGQDCADAIEQLEQLRGLLKSIVSADGMLAGDVVAAVNRASEYLRGAADVGGKREDENG